MPRRLIVFCTLAVLASALFTRLGFWQLARLHERQEFNALIIRQQQNRPIPFGELPRDTAAAHYRGARVTGRYDYDNELVLANRTRRGSPGVEIITPVKIAGSGAAVLVDRGWVYSPDGTSVDRVRWREGDDANLAGYVELYSPDTSVAESRDPRLVRRLNAEEIAKRIPYSVAPYYVVAVGDTADLSHPARRDLPALDEGPHRGYAFQWFSFTLIALGGAGIVLWRDRARRAAESRALHLL